MNKPTFNIRSIKKQDYEQWLQLWIEYNRFYGRTGPTSLDPLITQSTWSRFFDENMPVHAIIAESNGEIIGIVHYLYHFNTISINKSCYLQDLFTSENARGKGVASALIEETNKQARLAGSPRLYWHTKENNLTARKLYDKVAETSGFIVYSKVIS